MNNTLRVMICLLVLAAGNSYANETESVLPDPKVVLEKYTPQAQIDKLMEAGMYDLAIRKALDVVNGDRELSIEHCNLLLETSGRIRAHLATFQKCKQPTIFVPSFFRSKQSVAEESARLFIPSDKEIRENINFFEEQRDVLLNFKAKLDVLVRGTVADEAMAMKKRAEEEIHNLWVLYQKYISYDIISPYLFKAHVEAYIGAGGPFWNDDEEIIYKAAHIAAKACHKDWIFEASEDVQKQFLTVLAAIKKPLSDEEWNFALTASTLQPSLDPSKARGKKHWLQKK